MIISTAAVIKRICTIRSIVFCSLMFTICYFTDLRQKIQPLLFPEGNTSIPIQKRLFLLFAVKLGVAKCILYFSNILCLIPLKKCVRITEILPSFSKSHLIAIFYVYNHSKKVHWTFFSYAWQQKNIRFLWKPMFLLDFIYNISAYLNHAICILSS